jgi:hypothetical protein
MSSRKPARLATRSVRKSSVPFEPGRRGRARTTRVFVERLEERCMLSLLGLSQLATKPDIASGSRSNLSYTQIGNNANPFQYSATPLSLKMPDGSTDAITNQTSKTAAKTTLSLELDNFGYFASGGTSPDFAINGHVTVTGTTYDGSLLTAQAQEFGFSDTITTASADFDVRLTITGGLLTQSGGPFNVGDSLALLIHQPGLSISKFPASFSISNSFMGSSDAAHLPPQQFCLSSRQPESAASRPPLIGPNPISPITEPPSDSPGECAACAAAQAAATVPSRSTTGRSRCKPRTFRSPAAVWTITSLPPTEATSSGPTRVVAAGR